MRRFSATAALVLMFCFAGVFFVLAQEAENIIETPQAAAPEKVSPEEKTSEWVWGEVVSVDPAKNEITLKHLDYETYEEVQTTLKIDEKTTFENAANLSDIKGKDHVTADYRAKDGANIAELIVVEKEGAMKEEEKPMVVEQGAPAEEGSSISVPETVPVPPEAGGGIAGNETAQ